MSRYLAWFLASADAQEQLGLLDRGATRAGLGLKDLAGLRILLPPPLAEQRRIVARIEALFARTRQTRADLLRIAPLSDRYRLALLRSALRGEVDGGSAQPRWCIGACLLVSSLAPRHRRSRAVDARQRTKSSRVLPPFR